MAPPASPTHLPKARQRPGTSHALRWIGLVLLAVVLAGAAARLDLQALFRSALNSVQELGAWGPLLFILLYIAAAVLFIPGSALTMGAGAVFGLVQGCIYSSVAATLGAVVAFLIGRHLARGWVTRRLEQNPTFAALDRAVAEEGWRIVGLTRLSPLFPFTLLNYAYGLTRVRLWEYAAASWLGMLPGTVLYVYLGTLARVSLDGHAQTWPQRLLYGVGLLATIGVTIRITLVARRALEHRTRA